MTVTNFQQMDAFVARWEKAGGKERANYQMFWQSCVISSISPDSQEKQDAIS
jgi:hypothetical protein